MHRRPADENDMKKKKKKKKKGFDTNMYAPPPVCW